MCCIRSPLQPADHFSLLFHALDNLIVMLVDEYLVWNPFYMKPNFWKKNEQFDFNNRSTQIDKLAY